MSKDKTRYDLDDPKLPKDIDKGALTSDGYPYDKKLDWDEYEDQLTALQIELVKLQRHAQKEGTRIALVFEGRDAAGKGGSIKTYLQHLNPRYNRIVALPKPTDREATQWYFQRYVTHLPAAGETILFDRSWYNRAGVERVMGFCTEAEASLFLVDAPRFERMIINTGIYLFKFWLDISEDMQFKRFHKRRHSPLKVWKLSPIDLKALDHFDDYTLARNEMLEATDTKHAPWTIIRSNDKRRARIATIRTVLRAIDYEGKDTKAIGEVDEKIVLDAQSFLQEVTGD